MKEAMSRVDPSGGFEYSDITNPNQPYLFGSEFDEMHARDYARYLVEQYKGKTLSKEQLQQITDEHPNYRRPHLTKALVLLTTEDKAIASAKWGRGWSAGTTFRFVG